MWADYDYSNFPTVLVKFNENIEKEEQLNSFFQKWEELYEKGENFTFVFDTSNISFIKLSYISKIRNFIKKMKRKPRQYLMKSLIIISNKYLKYLVNLIFKFQSPISPLYLYNKKQEETLDYNCLLNKIDTNQHKEFTIIGKK